MKNQLRVLLLIPDLENQNYLGGIQTFNRYLVRALSELGVSTRVIALNDRPEDGNGRVDWVPCDRGDPRMRKPVALFEVLRSLTREKFDLVICGHLHFAPLCSPLCTAFRVPMLTLLHGIELWQPRTLDLAALRRSSYIACVSRYTQSLVLKCIPGFPSERVLLLHNTFDQDRFRPLSRSDALANRLGIQAGMKVLLTVGRLTRNDREKGYDEAIRAMAYICERRSDVQYVLAGRGDDRERLIFLGKDLGMGQNLIAPGFVPDSELPDLFNLCDVFVMPSRKEGFGIVFIEAMACGKPVVGGNLDGSLEPLCDGELGAAVDPKDPGAIATAIEELLDQKAPAHRSDPAHLRKEVVGRFGFDAFKINAWQVTTTAARRSKR